MGALLFVFTLATLGQANGPCFVPADQSAGWKRVDLPAEAPQLAAPEGISQFRSEQAVLVNDASRDLLTGATSLNLGSMTYTFTLPRGARRLEIEFDEPLRGAKVDASLRERWQTFPLWHERRVRENRVEVDLGNNAMPELELTVHHHLRGPPAVVRWKVTRTLVLDARDLPPRFLRRASLYFLHPGNTEVVLCQAPGASCRWTRAPSREIRSRTRSRC